MRKKHFNEIQIMGVLKEHEAGIAMPDLSRKHGIAESTLYAWRSKYAGMDVAELCNNTSKSLLLTCFFSRFSFHL